MSAFRGSNWVLYYEQYQGPHVAIVVQVRNGERRPRKVNRDREKETEREGDGGRGVRVDQRTEFIDDCHHAKEEVSLFLFGRVLTRGPLAHAHWPGAETWGWR